MLLFFGIVTVASGLIMALAIPVVREKEAFYQDEVFEPFSIRDFVREAGTLLKEPAFLYYFLTFLMFQRVASSYLMGLSYLYDNLILSKGVWTGLPDILIGIMGLILFPFIAKWIRQFGTKQVLSRMIIVSMVGYLLLTFVPATQGEALDMVKVLGVEIPGEKSYWITTLIYFVVYVGFSAVYTANGPIGKRLVDYLELKIGQRRPGTIKGVIGVLMTPSSALYVFLYTQIISAFGYDGASKVQDATAQWGIRLATGLLPAVMIMIGMVFWSKYPLDKELEDRVEAEMLAKHRGESDDEP
jgi:Na+/melibiose symporter-like transporter